MPLGKLSKEDSREIGRGLKNSADRGKRTSRLRSAPTEHHDQSRNLHREGRYQLIRTASILIPKELDKLDENVVADIAESILLYDLLHPIAIRRAANQRGGKNSGKFILVAGAHRLEAMKRLGKTKIPCFFIDGNKAYAELVRLGENLWRKSHTVLQQADALVRYLDLASTSLNISGHLGQKNKRGRPPGGIALAARELPVVGRSVHARRNMIKRAIKISRIEPEAKAAAIEAGLANNQDALLKIAEAGGQKSQLKMVRELAALSNKLNARDDTAKKPSVKHAKRTAIESPPLQPDAEELAAETVTTYNEMVALWKSKCRTSWAYLPFADRARFIEMLHRARQRARVDVVEFLSDVFHGREKIGKRDMFEFAATRGFAEATIRKTLKGLGYKSKREGRGLGARQFFLNPERDWKEQLRIHSDAELRAARRTQPEARDGQAPKGPKSSCAKYLSDVG